ncbi:hypothetical protein B1NLA3E_12405 [Bacillus sp. 1NLA3E]|nr:hypothetical protein B1NLA3E_12405 [Bacillus sp. 1NLA3E]
MAIKDNIKINNIYLKNFDYQEFFFIGTFLKDCCFINRFLEINHTSLLVNGNKFTKTAFYIINKNIYMEIFYKETIFK